MHPYQHAETDPGRLAFVVADTGETLTYGELDAASNRGAQLFRKLGLEPGDTIGLLLRNGPAFPIAYWAAQRAGLMICPLSFHLKPAEAAYILNDCGAKLLVTAAEVGETAAALASQRAELAPGLLKVLFAGQDALPGAESWDAATAQMPPTPIPDQISGHYLVYSSGTTGRPKGIVLPFERGPIENESPVEQMSRARLEPFKPLVTFNAAPLYHAAPLVSTMLTHRIGGLSVVLKAFDAVQVLSAIQTWKVNYAQFVPTMFVRLLALPEEVRTSFDLSSLRYVIHAAAPCPVEIKRRMIDWLGPIINEYYSGSEANGQCFITPQEWLQKPGSVGRASVGAVHICDEAGEELPAGREGLIYFESAREFRYLNDPEKTAKSRHPRHANWSALGDIGYLDEDGYLFLTDRKDFMIISGGVNIYPQGVENALVVHPKVADAAVIGVPNAEFGEEVKAVVLPKDWADANDAFAEELIAYCRERVSNVAAPRSVDFVRELPRLPTGKLAKHEVRKTYWGQTGSGPVALAARSDGGRHEPG
jgi:fatty-acyl-CoA synthase